jgi:hypothetical protein
MESLSMRFVPMLRLSDARFEMSHRHAPENSTTRDPIAARITTKHDARARRLERAYASPARARRVPSRKRRASSSADSPQPTGARFPVARDSAVNVYVLGSWCLAVTCCPGISLGVATISVRHINLRPRQRGQVSRSLASDVGSNLCPHRQHSINCLGTFIPPDSARREFDLRSSLPTFPISDRRRAPNTGSTPQAVEHHFRLLVPNIDIRPPLLPDLFTPSGSRSRHVKTFFCGTRTVVDSAHQASSSVPPLSHCQ